MSDTENPVEDKREGSEKAEDVTAYDNPLSAEAWKARISHCKRERRMLVQNWQINVDYRRGKPFQTESDSDRVNVNLDQPYTRAKHAQLFSQVPSVVLTTDNDQFKPLVGPFASRLNKELAKANVGAAVDESVIDCINASGVGAILVAFEERTEEVDVPAVDQMMAQAMQQAGVEVPMTKATRTTDRQFRTTHLSPDDLLWPIDWAGSDWDKAPWLGRTGRMFWPEAKAAFNLKDEDRDTICDSGYRRDRIRTEPTASEQDIDVVEFDEIFFRLAMFDSSAKYFGHVQRLVFVHGKDAPVVDEPAKHQKLLPNGQYVGSCKYPLQVLTLDYVSDDAIPSSDSAIARPQVDELIAHRTQTILNRKRSIPARWHDVNKLDPLTSANLMKGTWQNSIPVKGNGDGAIGEVKRTAYPADDYRAADTAMRDASIAWGLGPNQAGAFAQGERSATEAREVSDANDTQIGYQRGRVAKFFCAISEVFGGLLALYGDMPGMDALASEFAYTIRPDSTVLLSAAQRTKQLAQFLNLTANSGFINPAPVIEEMCALNNVDPAKVMKQPSQKPEAANISYRFSGEDMSNPLAVAVLMAAGQFPTPQEVEASKQAILASASLPQPVAPQGPPQGAPPLPRIGPGLDRITKRTDEV
jgi:hypothetical protein